jgi:hypothetical protein
MLWLSDGSIWSAPSSRPFFTPAIDGLFPPEIVRLCAAALRNPDRSSAYQTYMTAFSSLGLLSECFTLVELISSRPIVPV